MSKINASEIAEPFRAAIREEIASSGLKPKLVGILANDDQAAEKYALWTGKACEKDGIAFELRKCTKQTIEDEIQAANRDRTVHGVIVYYPCFGKLPTFMGQHHTMDDFIRDSVAITKDVEGMSFFYRNCLYRNVRFLDGETKAKKAILPCTALSITKIIEHLGHYDRARQPGDQLKGKTITIVNRSDIVGRPLAAMLANDGATVYSVDIDSIYRVERKSFIETELTAEEAIAKSDIVVTGVPVKSYLLPVEHVREGATVINFSHHKNVEPEKLLAIKDVRYVPLVGKVTVAMLERNVVRLCKAFDGQANFDGMPQVH